MASDKQYSDEKVYFVSYWLVGLYVLVTVVFVTTVGVAVHAANTHCSCPAGMVRVETAQSPVDANPDTAVPVDSKAANIPNVQNKRSVLEDDTDDTKRIRHKPLSHKFKSKEKRPLKVRAKEEDQLIADVECPSTPAPGTDDYWTTCTDYAWTTSECAPEARQCDDLQYRLPKNLKPHHYDVEVKADIYQPDPADFTIEGWVTIHLECMDRTNKIIFHRGPRILIDQTSVVVLLKTATSDTVLQPTSITEDIPKNFYILTLGQVLNVGDNITVFMQYSAPMLNDGLGYYWNSYKEGGQTKYMTATQFEAYKARYAFPCLDEPAMKATFNVTLWRKPYMTALSNTLHYHSLLMSDGWMKDFFYKTPVVYTTYLVAFAVANFTYISDTSPNGHLFRHWGEPQYIDAGLAEYSKSIAGLGLDYFENHFGIAYPLAKEDQIAVPSKGGAMENWGLITYGRTRLYWDPLFSTTQDLNRLTNTMYHELLHMWLGNLVTCDWWSDIWLNEAFARFYQHWAVTYFKPTWNAEYVFWTYALSRALHIDDSGTTHPLHNPTVQTTAETDAMMSSITYDKGGSVLRMMHHLVLSNAWNESMQTYVSRYQYSSANAYDLLSVWDEIAVKQGVDHGASMTEIMDTWILQQGYPILTVSITPSNAQIDVSQRRFLQNPDGPKVDSYPPPYEYTWEIPVTFVTNRDPANPTLQWLHKDDRTFSIGVTLDGPGDWILVNYKQNGYFRVNYDVDNWMALITQIATDSSVIDPLNRAQIIDDSFSIAREGSLDYTIALQSTQYLVGETEYIPWYASSLGLGYIERILKGSPDYENYRMYMRKLVEQNYNSLGWEERQQDLHFTIYLRGLILRTACDNGHVECIQEAQTKFDSWKTSPSDMTIITPDQRSNVFCTAIRYGLSDDWDFLFGRYSYYLDIDHFSSIRTTIRTALTCSTEQWVLNRYYQWAADGDARIAPADRTSILTSIARNPAGRALVWNNIDSNWNNAYARQSVMSAVTESFSTSSEKEKLLSFITDHPPTSAEDKSYYDGLLVNVDANLKWRLANEQTVMNWFQTTLPLMLR